MIRRLLLRFLIWRGGGDLLVLFMAMQIIKHPERYLFSDMPNSLKAQIAEVLIDSGAAHLINEEQYKEGA